MYNLPKTRKDNIIAYFCTFQITTDIFTTSGLKNQMSIWSITGGCLLLTGSSKNVFYTFTPNALMFKSS